MTIFTIPKPFKGEIAGIQRTAIESWQRIAAGVEIVLVGDEPGTAQAARELALKHVPALRGALGTPRIDAAFAAVDAVASFDLRCFANADIVLGPDLGKATDRVRTFAGRFLLVGETRDLDPALVDLNPERGRLVALGNGVLRGPAAIDWFVFPRDLFDPIPPFVVGRAGFDNWLVWRARRRAVVVDATDAVVAVHQTHHYAHIEGGKDVAYYGPEADSNIRLAGGKSHIYTLLDASHRMRADLTIRRNPVAVLRVGETMRKVKWKLGVR